MNNLRFQPTKNYVFRRLVEESLLVPISPHLKERNCLYVFNVTGRALFEGVCAGLNKKELQMKLLDDFEGCTIEQAEQEVVRFLDELQKIEAIDAIAAD